MYTVYMHTCKTTQKRYVGITCQQPWTRRFNGDGSGYKNCVHFYRAILKYGWDDFDHQVLETCETEKEAMRLERHYIKLYQTNDDTYGYNIKEGGEHQRYPKEIRDRISASNKGRKSPTEGTHRSEETKRKIRDAQKGRPLTPEHAENCRRATREYYKTHSPAHTFTEEDYVKSLEARRVKIKVLETNEIFDSMTECANAYNVNIANLSRTIKLNRPYKGFHFEKVCS